MKETLSFKIEGEFITKLAREKCYMDSDYDGALRILIGALHSSELSEREIRHIAVDILDGYAKITGLSGTKDYGVIYLDEKDNNWSLNKLIQDKAEKFQKKIEELRDLQEKSFFICENIDEWDLRRINDEYFDCFDEYLFEDLVPEPLKRKPGESSINPMLDSYLKRMQQEDISEDYGWLEPNGTFHAVEWGEHEAWAWKYIEQNVPEKDHEKYRYDGRSGDYLTEKGWVLLHNPGLGIAKITKHDELQELTKKQKEFLFDYYMDRDCPEEANSLYNDDYER